MNRFYSYNSLTSSKFLLAILLLGLGALLTNYPVVQAEPIGQPDEEIIYIDSTGFVQVLDTNTDGGTEIKWRSPVGSQYDFAVGDFNNDGDAEIVTVGGPDLRVYDPVVSQGTVIPGQETNGVPWKQLYQRSAPANISLIGSGNLDSNVPGDEIIYGYNLNGVFTIVILKATTTTPDGTSWQEHASRSFEHPWNHVAVGNVNGTGSDEIVLIDSESDRTEIILYEVDNNFREIYQNRDSSKRWESAAIGQIYAGGTGEVLASRSAFGLANLFLFQLIGGSLTDVDGDALGFVPSPNFAFLADVNGSGDEEALFLRRGAVANQVRLVLINRGTDGVAEFEEILDADDGYKVGAGGDIDGDGRDEVVIMRNNKIRVYTDVGSSNTNKPFNEYIFGTNDRSLKIADLDKNGFVQGPQFHSTLTRIDTVTLEIEQQSPEILIDITNSSGSEAVPFTASVDGNPSWVTVRQFQSQTPTKIGVRFNANGISVGTYTTQIRLTSSNTTVVNQPYLIDLVLTVVPATFTLSPSHLSFSPPIPCTPPLSVETQTIQVNGATGVRYTAAIVDVPTTGQRSLTGIISGGYLASAQELVIYDEVGNTTSIQLPERDTALTRSPNIDWPDGLDWVTASSTTATVPENIVITVDPNLREEDFERALLVVVGDASTGSVPDSVRLATIDLICAQSQVSVPVILQQGVTE